MLQDPLAHSYCCCLPLPSASSSQSFLLSRTQYCSAITLILRFFIMADRYSSHIAGPSSAPHKGGPGAAMPPASPAVHDKHEKPQLTLIQLVEMAMEAQGSRLTTAQICEWISTKFPYYTADPPKFKKSMRDTLSRNSIFINHKRSPGNPGLGDYWTIRKGRKHQVRVHAGVQASGIAPQDQEDRLVFDVCLQILC